MAFFNPNSDFFQEIFSFPAIFFFLICDQHILQEPTFISGCSQSLTELSFIHRATI